MRGDLTEGWHAEASWRGDVEMPGHVSPCLAILDLNFSSGKAVTRVFNLGMAVFGNLIGFCCCFETSSYCVDLSGLELDR